MAFGEKVRVARREDIPAITETLCLAFHRDPTWSWAFPDEAERQRQYAIFWGLYVREAMRFDRPAVFVTEGVEAAAMWLPPGEVELSPEQEERLPELVRELVGDHADAVMELFDGFEGVQPEAPPHYYLSLLGVHDDHRGKGIGMRLLAENLERFDGEGVPDLPRVEQRCERPPLRGAGLRADR